MKKVTYTVPPRPDSNISGEKAEWKKKTSDKKPRTAEVGTSTGEQLYNWTFLCQNLVMSNYVIFEKM